MVSPFARVQVILGRGTPRAWQIISVPAIAKLTMLLDEINIIGQNLHYWPKLTMLLDEINIIGRN